MQITTEHLIKILPTYKSPADLAKILNKVLPKYSINTINRIAGFLAQCGHESNGFTVLKENLNYSASGLRATFPKYFKDENTANQYAKKPEMIANRIYASRMGNGAEQSGDGYKYRGRGAIQLTGHDNYKLFSAAVAMSINEAVGYLETINGAVESACWFWNTNGLNAICDADNIVAMTKRINGGTIGLTDRTSHYQHAKQVLDTRIVVEGTKPNPESTEEIELEIVKLGSCNETVKIVQQALGLAVDGTFGPATEKALKGWQHANGLTDDGIAGKDTLLRLLN